MRELIPLLPSSIIAVAASTWTCTTSLDAIGTGGAGSGESATAVVTAVSTVSTVGVTTGLASNPEGPCGLYFDWSSCEVTDLTPVDTSPDQASGAIVGVWRRCNETMTGEFPVAVKLEGDGTLYRMYRKPNPYGTGTMYVVHCGAALGDRGSWSLVENDGGGGGPQLGGDHLLQIEWDDGATDAMGVVLYPGLQAFGLLHAETDTEETTERFKPEADLIPGTEP